MDETLAGKQKSAELTSGSDGPSPLDERGLCLLSLDGGGVRGLSSLYVLKRIMANLNDERRKDNLPACKPCEIFDLIAGTSTGGLIAIMLGRLEMDVDECITAYGELSEHVFNQKLHRYRITLKGRIQPRFDSNKLEAEIDRVIQDRGLVMSELFNNSEERGCKVFVCATTTDPRATQRLRSYDLADKHPIPATIKEVALATSAATGFFKPVTIDDSQYVDGALGANNPLNEVEGEASDIWCRETGDLKPLVKCFISIGTGNPGTKSISDKLPKFVSDTLIALVTETENTAEHFIRRWRQHFDERRYFRFNVEQGLQDVGLAEYEKKGKMVVATNNYLESQEQAFRLRDCVRNLKGKQKLAELNVQESIDAHSRLAQERMMKQNITTVETDSCRVPCHNLPFLENKRFVGRTTTLDELTDMFFGEEYCNRVALAGLGGVGKTQTALHFAYWIIKTKPEYRVFWMSALSVSSFEQSYASIARKLQISKDGEDSKPLVREFLESNKAGPWFLVVDNADDVDLVRHIDQQLPESPKGRILFTTRTREVAQVVAESDVVDLFQMEPKEAKALLEKSVTKKGILRDDSRVTELLEELTYLPLAITQAAAYLNRNSQSISTYLGLLRGAEQDMVQLLSREFDDRTRYKESQNSVATTWVVSFEEISWNDPRAAVLLFFISRIEPRAIPLSILPNLAIKTTTPAENVIPRSETTVELNAKSIGVLISLNGGTKEELTYSVGTLCAYAFLVQREGQDVFDMHSLVHLVTRIWVQKHESTAETTHLAYIHLEPLFPEFDIQNRGQCEEYLPHALRLLKSDEQYDTPQTGVLCVKISDFLSMEQRYTESVECCERCFRWACNRFPDDNHSRRLESELRLGRAYELVGRYPEALKLVQHVSTVCERTLPDDDPMRLRALNHLAGLYSNMGKNDMAMETIEKAMTLHTQTQQEDDDPHRLLSLVEHALAHLKSGSPMKAIELAQQALAQVNHARQPSLQITILLNLTVAYAEIGLISTAIEYGELALPGLKKAFVETNPLLLVFQRQLARFYLSNGQTIEAILLLQHVVAMQEKTLAEDHPERLTVQKDLESAQESLAKLSKHGRASHE